MITTGTLATARLPASASAWTVNASDIYRASGLVGIGTTTPATILHVKATADNPRFEEASSSDNAKETLALYRSRGDAIAPGAGFSTALSFELEGNTNGSRVNASRIVSGWEGAQTDNTTSRDSYISFQTMQDNAALAEIMRVTSSGNVGIGTTNPGEKLQVYSSDASVSMQVMNSNSTSARFPQARVTNFMGTGAGLGGYPSLYMQNYRSSAGGAASAVQSGDIVGSIVTGGGTGSGFTASWNPMIWFTATETFSGTANGTKLMLATVPNGSSTSVTRMAIQENGHIGVGTTAPWAKFEVRDTNVDTGQIRVVNENSTSARYPAFTAINYIGTAGSGHPAVNLNNSRGSMSVPAALQNNDVLGAVNFLGSRDAAYNTNTGALIFASAAETFSATAAGSNLYFQTAANGTTSPSTRMTILQNGNVGIGTTSPDQKLSVAGNLGLDSGDLYFRDLNGSSALFDAFYASPYVWNSTAGSESAGVTFYAKVNGSWDNAMSVSDYVYFNNEISAEMPWSYFNRYGNDAWGHWIEFYKSRGGSSSSKTAVLQWDDLGGISAQGYTSANDWSAGWSAIGFEATENFTSTANGSQIYFQTVANGTTTAATRMIIDPSGYVGIGTTSPTSALHVVGNIQYTGTITDISDARLKKNVAPLEGGLEKIRKVPVYSYIMKDDPEKKTEFGVMAQELEKIFPELVRVVDLTKGYKGVNYVGLIPWSISAIQDLDSEVAKLKKENEEIRSDLKKLMEQNQLLMEQMKALMESRQPARAN